MSGVLNFYCESCDLWFAEPIYRQTFPGNRFEPAEHEWCCPSCERPTIEEMDRCKCEEDGRNRPAADGLDYCAAHFVEVA